MPDNEDLVEGVAVGDEFHDAVASMVANYGRGEAVAIVWTSAVGVQGGMVVSQLQYGMTAYSFHLETCPGGFTLCMLGRKKAIRSDYFEEFCHE